jgi:catalase
VVGDSPRSGRFVSDSDGAVLRTQSLPGTETRADFLRAVDPEQADKNYLFDALIASIHNNPLQWHLVITVGQAGDHRRDAPLAAGPAAGRRGNVDHRPCRER